MPPNTKDFKDFLVETSNPDYLDDTIQQWGAVLVGRGTSEGYIKQDGYYVMRCFSNPDFIKFAVDNQGYGKIIREITGSLE